MRDQEKFAKPRQLAQTGWCGQTIPGHTTPSAPSKEASLLLLDVAATPPPAEEGSRRITTPEFFALSSKPVPDRVSATLYFSIWTGLPGQQGRSRCNPAVYPNAANVAPSSNSGRMRCHTGNGNTFSRYSKDVCRS